MSRKAVENGEHVNSDDLLILLKDELQTVVGRRYGEFHFKKSFQVRIFI